MGADFCALRSADGRQVFVAYRGIASVRPEGRAPTATGDRPVQLAVGLAEALAVLAEEPAAGSWSGCRDRRGAEGLAGVLRSVGRDVLVAAAGRSRPADGLHPARQRRRGAPIA